MLTVSVPDGERVIGRIAAGDGLEVLRRTPDGALHAVYLDPPFFTQTTRIADAGAFSDGWPTLAAYLEWLGPWIEETRRVLHPAGWFWLHLDWHAVHYARVLTDGIFGPKNFRNEIVWHYTGRRMPGTRHFNRKHDTLLLYARSPRSRLTPLFEPWTREDYLTRKRQRLHVDADGREWIWGHAGRGRSHAYRIDVTEQVRRGRALDSVWELPIINTSARERTGWPTQKPEALLRRIVEATVPEGGQIGDFMAGSGTTAVAAALLGRRFSVAERDARAVRLMVERLRRHGFVVAPAEH